MIAVVYPQFYGVGGIARYLDSFLSNLPAGHPPVILITGDENHKACSYPGVEIIHVPFTSNRFNLVTWGLAARRLLLQLHSAGRIRFVNLHWPPLIPALFLPRSIPVVLTAHTTYLGMSGRFYEPRRFESQWSNSSIVIKMWMERRIFGNVDRVIALTEQGKQEVLQYGFAGPITVIPNGADTQKFQTKPEIQKDIDVLFSGRIERRKGSVPMVEVCKRLVAAKPGIQICIVGYGDDDAWVAQELGPLAANVRLAGKVPFDDMVNYYNRCQVYASTSYYEGLPGTCLEAMAMQLPAVVWDFLFYRGLVTEGQTGSVAPPNDFDTFIAKTLALLNNKELAAQMGANGRELLVTEYDWSKLAVDVLKVFES
jgi:glycosyltransferase involved in cell wall biosynthesis